MAWCSSQNGSFSWWARLAILKCLRFVQKSIIIIFFRIIYIWLSTVPTIFCQSSPLLIASAKAKFCKSRASLHLFYLIVILPTLSRTFHISFLSDIINWFFVYICQVNSRREAVCRSQRLSVANCSYFFFFSLNECAKLTSCPAVGSAL